MRFRSVSGNKIENCHCGREVTYILECLYGDEYLCEVCLPNYLDVQKHLKREAGAFGDVENLCDNLCIRE